MAQTPFLEFYENLNPGQKQAVDTIDGPVMVLAGPGTGKTQVLAMRIANILERTHMDPWNILCLTFTESGVIAMRERLVKIIGPTAYQLHIHTFHSFCNDIIQAHPEIFALARDWQVLAEVERVEMLREILDSLPGTSSIKPFGNPYLFLGDLASNIKQLKQEDISADTFKEVLDAIEGFIKGSRLAIDTFCELKPTDRSDSHCEEVHGVLKEQAKKQKLPASLIAVIERTYTRYQDRIVVADGKRDAGKARTAYKNELKKWFEKLDRQLPKQREMRLVYMKYQKELKTKGRYDYEDMVIMVVSELRTNDNLLAQYQEQFQYVLVDEYQDTNGAQNELVYLLGSFDSQPNLFVVGDDKQSIYRFQGASLNNMLSFYTTYKEHIKVVALQENYRSQPVVLQTAGAVINHNEESITKYIPGISNELQAASGRKAEHIERYTFASEEAEDYAIAQQVKTVIDSGVSPKDIAVLFRYNRDGHGLLRFMQQLKVPARLEAGENVLEDVTVNQWLTIWEYVTQGQREDLLSSMIQYPWWGIDSLDALKVIHYAGRYKKSLFIVLTDPDLLEKAGATKTEPIKKFIEHLAHWQQLSATMVLQELLSCMITESGWMDYVLAHTNQPVTLVMLQRMTTLLNEAKRLNYTNHKVTLSDFLAHIHLLREHHVPLNAEPWQVAQNAVRLMTAHKAKGLEFEYVFITRLNDKHWGNNPEPNKLSLPHGFVRYDMVVAQENNEDERRLFYVAVTRAKQHLTLSRSAHSVTGRPTIPSIFWEETPTDLVNEHSVKGEEVTQEITRLAATVSPSPIPDHDGMRDWLHTVLKGYVMSVTHLNNYLECPRRFYIRNLLRIPTVRTPSQSLGTAIHNALNDFSLTFKRQGVLPSVQDLIQSFNTYVAQEILKDVEKKDTLQRGEQLLTSYYATYIDTFSPNVLTEYSFDDHGVHIGDIRITGAIDKVELVDAKDIQKSGAWREGACVNVVDYKTGSPEKGLLKLKDNGDYFRQIVFYKLLCDRSERFPYTMSTGEVDFIQPTKNGQYIKKKVEVTKEDTDELIQTIKQVWQDIHELKFLEADGGCDEDDCEYCDHSHPHLIS